MKIIVAKTAGFCMGVKRAVDVALEQSAKTPDGIHTIGPLIHNHQTVEMLKQRGVITYDENKAPPAGSTLMIRAHGIPPDLQKRLSENGSTIIDGTCPKVKTVHKVIERHRALGYRIVITGDEGHAEVIGLLGYAGNTGILIHSVEEVESLPECDKICLVSQTTFDRTIFDEIAEKIKQRYLNADVVIKKTICSATDQRQKETECLARQVEALIVVGGKNSANTQRLASIATRCGTPTQHVETEAEIDWDKISKCKVIGITAGASTPNWMINKISDYLQFMNQTRKRNIKNFIWHLFDILTNLNVFVSMGAVAVYYTSSYLQGFKFSVFGAQLSFLYFLSMYLWNSLASIETTQHHGISRYHFYNAHKRLLYIISGTCILTILIFSFFAGTQLFYLMLFAIFAGSAYHMTIVPKFLQPILHYKNLKDIPTSRDLFVALAWGTVLTFTPQALCRTFTIKISTLAVFFLVFILAYLRSLIFDLKDLEGDRIMGRETLITIIGEKRARKAIQIIILICLFVLLITPAIISPLSYTNHHSIQILFQIPALLYVAAFVKWNPEIRQNRIALFNFLADGLFYLSGLGALAALFITS
jgi:(E)-4-hydroxy-3-methyl-but-2-enyl pyrophosphate reductase